MVTKKQLDYFILKESFKVFKDIIKEEEGTDFFATDSIAQDEAIVQAEKRLIQKKNDIKEIDIRKKMHQSSISKMIDPTDRAIETLQAKKFEERLKVAKEELNDLTSKIEDLKKAKSNSEKLNKSKEKTEKQMSVQQGSEIGEALTPLGKSVGTKPKPKKRELVVRFDTNTAAPFTVKFTSRGFVVGNTRLSFELVEKAISKQFSITLKTGLILTPVKMQKLLKYKNRY